MDQEAYFGLRYDPILKKTKDKHINTGNNGQGGGGGNKPITIKIREQNNLVMGLMHKR